MANDDYVAGALVVDAGTPVPVGGITQLNVNMGAQITSEPTSGGATPKFNAISGIQPTASFTSKAIREIFDNFPTTGLDIGGISGTAGLGLDLFGRRLKSGGTRDDAGSIRYRIAQGIVGLTSLSVDHQGDAAMSGSILATWDGANDPIVKAEGIPFPDVSGEDRYTIGKMTVGGVVLEGIQNIEIDFGQNMQAQGSDSDIFNKRASIRDYAPVITVRGDNPDWWIAAGIPTAGLPAIKANSIISLVKRLQGSTYEADATTVHITIAFDGTAVIETPFEASGNEPAELVLRIVLYDAAGITPMVINTAAAIV